MNGTSIVIARDDYFNIMFVYSLLLLSICLDIFLAMVFCIIQNSYHKFYEQKLLLLGSAINSNKSSIVKQKMPSRRRRIASLESKETSKSFEESLEFIESNLEDDRCTIKSINKIRKDTNLSYYRIRKCLADLMDKGLIIRKKQRLILVDNALK